MRNVAAAAASRVVRLLPLEAPAGDEKRRLEKEIERLRAQLAAVEAPRTPDAKTSRKVQTTVKPRAADEQSALVIKACSETAKAFASPASQFHRVKQVFDALCAVKKEDEAVLESLVARVKSDETLRFARACGTSVYDGASLLHAAAAKGRDHVVRRLLRPDVGFSASQTLDTVGRTALHVAAEHGHLETCAVLKRAMEVETGRSPVGADAPPDLAGRTPLAWASDRVRDKQRRDELEEQLFAEGDATVLPTPRTVANQANQLRTAAAFAASAAPGWRVDMEDSYACWSPLPKPSYADESQTTQRPSLYAVFDGHGGSLCAQLAAERLADVMLEKTEAWRDYEDRGAGVLADEASVLAKAVVDSLLALDAELASHPRLTLTRRERRTRDGESVTLKAEDDSGSTAVVALVSRQAVIVANLGDSGAIRLDRRPPGRWRISRPTPKWTATPLTTAHKPEQPTEKSRLEAFGANIEDGYVVYAGRKQATSRSLGDFAFKRSHQSNNDIDHIDGAVSALAEVFTIPRNNDDRALILLATDGLWDVLTPNDAAAIVGDILERDPLNLQFAVDRLVAACVRAKSRDNVTAVIVDLGPPRRDVHMQEIDDSKSVDKFPDLPRPTKLFSARSSSAASEYPRSY